MGNKLPIQFSHDSAMVTLLVLEGLFRQENKQKSVHDFLSSVSRGNDLNDFPEYVINPQFMISILYSTILIFYEKDYENKDGLKIEIESLLIKHLNVEKKDDEKKSLLNCIRNSIAHYNINLFTNGNVEFFDQYNKAKVHFIANMKVLDIRFLIHDLKALL